MIKKFNLEKELNERFLKEQKHMVSFKAEEGMVSKLFGHTKKEALIKAFKNLGIKTSESKKFDNKEDAEVEEVLRSLLKSLNYTNFICELKTYTEKNDVFKDECIASLNNKIRSCFIGNTCELNKAFVKKGYITQYILTRTGIPGLEATLVKQLELIIKIEGHSADYIDRLLFCLYLISKILETNGIQRVENKQLMILFAREITNRIIDAIEEEEADKNVDSSEDMNKELNEFLGMESVRLGYNQIIAFYPITKEEYFSEILKNAFTNNTIENVSLGDSCGKTPTTNDLLRTSIPTCTPKVSPIIKDAGTGCKGPDAVEKKDEEKSKRHIKRISLMKDLKRTSHKNFFHEAFEEVQNRSIAPFLQEIGEFLFKYNEKCSEGEHIEAVISMEAVGENSKEKIKKDLGCPIKKTAPKECPFDNDLFESIACAYREYINGISRPSKISIVTAAEIVRD